MTTAALESRSPSVTTLNQRLAARFHQRQAGVVRRSNVVADRIGPLYRELAAELAEIAAEEGLAGLAELRKAVDAALDDARRALGDALTQAGLDGHDSAAEAVLRALPREWLGIFAGVAAAKIEEARAPELEPDPLEVRYEWEPIAQRAVSRDEAMSLIRGMLLPSPTEDQARAWLTDAPPGGLSWEERLRRWEGPARAAMLSELSIGLAAEENVDDLRGRLKPFADGIAWKAQRIARTEANRVAERASRAAFDGMGELVDGLQVVAVMDEWTRSEHAHRNGRIYRRGEDGVYRGDDGEELPDLPDAPNCRCMTIPVMSIPEAFEQDPALRATFETATKDLIPDPASYSDWWKRADPREQMTAVGVRRWRVMSDRMSTMVPPRQVQWEDFLAPDGSLVPTDVLRRESLDEWAARRREVDTRIHRRRAEFATVARLGYEPPQANLPIEIRRAMEPTLAQQWGAQVNRQIREPLLDSGERKRRDNWGKTLRPGNEVREEVLTREQYHASRRQRLEQLAQEIRESPLPAGEQQAMLRRVVQSVGEHRREEAAAIARCIEVPRGQRGRLRVRIDRAIPEADRTQLQEGIDWVGRVVPKSTLKRTRGTLRMKDAPAGGPYAGRPYYDEGTRTAYFPAGRRTREDAVHETVHHLESFMPRTRRRLRAHYQRVTEGATLIHLGEGYRANEFYLPRTDGRTWWHNYQGSTGGREMITMKTELLARDPRRLLQEDPELFDTLITELRGL